MRSSVRGSQAKFESLHFQINACVDVFRDRDTILDKVCSGSSGTGKGSLAEISLGIVVGVDNGTNAVARMWTSEDEVGFLFERFIAAIARGGDRFILQALCAYDPRKRGGRRSCQTTRARCHIASERGKRSRLQNTSYSRCLGQINRAKAQGCACAIDPQHLVRRTLNVGYIGRSIAGHANDTARDALPEFSVSHGIGSNCRCKAATWSCHIATKSGKSCRP